MSGVTVTALGVVKLTPNERLELNALTHSLADRLNAAPDDIDAVRIIVEASANAIHDRDLLACLATNQTAMIAAQNLRDAGERTGAASIQGAANVVATAAKRLDNERLATT